MGKYGQVQADEGGAFLWSNDVIDIKQVSGEISALGIGTVYVLPIDSNRMTDVPVSSKTRTFLDRHLRVA